ncbi:hypothetical protein [Nocardia transvalensis]|uniref:hypothetical protein n=1 Tax=Nocardia transvalensis TaxID=37333 RepID=UPI0018932B0B|nr:hypothetical protein [Nocardia transvalensis]MBF6333241.1 hypothetical protein [Nocardia transvalensis]
MTEDRQAQLDAEQHQLREAAKRLLTGAPHRSNGKLTVAGLATEANVPRHRLYEHHTELIAEFKAAAGGGPIPVSVQALQQQLDDALARERKLIDTNKILTARIRALAAVIAEFTLESTTSNIVPFGQRPTGILPRTVG